MQSTLEKSTSFELVLIVLNLPHDISFSGQWSPRSPATDDLQNLERPVLCAKVLVRGPFFKVSRFSLSNLVRKVIDEVADGCKYVRRPIDRYVRNLRRLVAPPNAQRGKYERETETHPDEFR